MLIKIIILILCWFVFGFIGFLLYQIYIADYKDVLMINEEKITSDFIGHIILGFIGFISVMINLIGIYTPKLLTPFVIWLMKIIQKIRRK